MAFQCIKGLTYRALDRHHGEWALSYRIDDEDDLCPSDQYGYICMLWFWWHNPSGHWCGVYVVCICCMCLIYVLILLRFVVCCKPSVYCTKDCVCMDIYIYCISTATRSMTLEHEERICITYIDIWRWWSDKRVTTEAQFTQIYVFVCFR